MATTGAPWNIWIPDTTSPVAPLQTLFSTQATSIAVALSALQTTTPRRVADLTALAALTPVATYEPVIVVEGGAIFIHNGTVWVQATEATFASAGTRDTAYAKAAGAYCVSGAQVRRTDTRWVEEYFTIYNSGTNPAGARVAGWYPVSGAVLGGRVVRSATASAALGAGGYSVPAATFWSDSLAGASKANGFAVAFATNGGWTVPLDGMYEFDCGLATSGTGAVALLLKKNSAAADGAGKVLWNAAGTTNGVGWVGMDGKVPLAAGDIIRAAVLAATSQTIGTTPEEAYFSCRFVEPVRA